MLHQARGLREAERLPAEKVHQLLRARLGHPHLLRQVRAQRHAPREEPSLGIIVHLPVAKHRTLNFEEFIIPRKNQSVLLYIVTYRIP